MVGCLRYHMNQLYLQYIGHRNDSCSILWKSQAHINRKS